MNLILKANLKVRKKHCELEDDIAKINKEMSSETSSESNLKFKIMPKHC